MVWPGMYVNLTFDFHGSLTRSLSSRGSEVCTDDQIRPVLVWLTHLQIVFELYEKAEEHFIRVLFGGQPLETSTRLGTLNLVPVEKFIDCELLSCAFLFRKR